MEDIMLDELSGFSINIADVTVRLTSQDMVLEPRPFYKNFVVTNGFKPDINIRVFYRAIPDMRPQQKIFDAGVTWSLYDWQGKYLFTFSTPVVTPNLHKVAIFDRDFAHGDVYMRPYADDSSSRDPLGYPFDELLMVNYLAQGRGIDIHAFGVVASDSFGMAFVGVSGAGKSTSANLWKSRNVKLLCDDRIILRKQEGGFWLYSTPWHGDAKIATPGKAPLRSLFFLKQAKDNRIVSLNPIDAATRLMVCCFPTFYRVTGMEFTLDFITELTQEVPCYELQFTPDQRAVDEVLRHVESRILSSR